MVWAGLEKWGCEAKDLADPLGNFGAGVREPYLYTHVDQSLDVDCTQSRNRVPGQEDHLLSLLAAAGTGLEK